MRTVVIGGVEHKLDCNALTPFYYSEQFLVNRGGRMVCEDINDAIAAIFSSMGANGIPPMLKMQQMLWAFEKTANPDTMPGFKEWAATGPMSMLDITRRGGWSEAVTNMIKEYFFPSQPQEDVGAEPEQAPAATAAERA